MKIARQLIAALMLLAWFCAGAHVTLEHGGEAFGAAAHAEDHHDEGSAPSDDDPHHHDLGAVTFAQFTKSAEQQLLAPEWQPLYDNLVAELAALLRGLDDDRPAFVDLLPDERASGWLFVVQTAHPVRGPSLG